MSHHFSQLVALDQTVLVDAERLVALFEQGVQPVQDRRVAQIGILKDYPLSMNNSIDEDRVDPLKSALTLGCRALELIELVQPQLLSSVQCLSILLQESFEYLHLLLYVSRPP